jgi:rSAM-associated Gly-rich repeat protein
MTTKNQMSKALSLVLPTGALGASLLLALSSAQAAISPPASADAASGQIDVATRLKAIRAGVTEMSRPGGDGSAQIEEGGTGALIPTWWGNGGWGRWHGGWGNGGWGWHNGGWGNGGWHNWGNGWHNGGWGNGGWGNGGWHNFWHNG